MNKETLKEAGYEHVEARGHGEHLLRVKATGELEIWFNSKNHASYGLVYKNTHLEFARSV